MTDIQIETLQKIRMLLAEHFDSAMVVTNTDDYNDSNKEIPNVFFTGSPINAIGLAQFGYSRIMMSIRPPDDLPTT